MVSSGRSLSGAGQGFFHDLDTRFEVTPGSSIGVGGFLVFGNDFDYSKKGRWGINGRFNIGKTLLNAEYAVGKNGPIQCQGVNTELGYWITESFQSMVRFETFSPNQSMDILGRAETLGLSYYLRKYLTKFQAALTVMQNMAAANGTPSFAKGADSQVFTLAVQTSI